ncbi:hypothetical protein [Proteiniclasticum sp.]|uniref:hypothetical protein n=1 Tax=Proteiniclasticum sp. TaxID=2053595 RepID=UPI002899635D|nr:hypothetical protein [Proteiniclasticum sp.]
MDDKNRKIEDIAKKAGKLTSDVMTVSGEALGLLALKLGNESLAYKTIKAARDKSEGTGRNVEKFLDENIKKVHVRVQEKDIQDFKDKAEGVAKDFKESLSKIDLEKIREDIKSKASSVVTTETRVYGDADHFYSEKDKVGGIVIDEMTWKEEE